MEVTGKGIIMEEFFIISDIKVTLKANECFLNVFTDFCQWKVDGLNADSHYKDTDSH